MIKTESPSFIQPQYIPCLARRPLANQTHVNGFTWYEVKLSLADGFTWGRYIIPFVLTVIKA